MLRPRPQRLRLVEGESSATLTPTPIAATATAPALAWPGGGRARAEHAGEEAPPSAAFARGAATLTDAQLVTLGARGDRQSLEALYRRHAAFAIHLATRIEGSARDVEDVVHDAFLKAFERLDDLADRSAFKAWLGSIVVHAVRSRMRRARLMNLLGSGFVGRSAEPVDLDAIASSDASPHTRAQIAQIYALLRTLAVDERIAWTLRSVEGHDLETVARMTRCSLATVKRRIRRAQTFLDEHFVEPSAAPGPAPADRAGLHPALSGPHDRGRDDRSTRRKTP